MTLKKTAKRFLAALAVMEDMADRGQDDTGERDSPSYREWLAADCEYTEALDALRKWCNALDALEARMEGLE